jgi:TolB protein
MRFKSITTTGAALLTCLTLSGSPAPQAQIEIGTTTGADTIRFALPDFPLEARPGGNPAEAAGFARVFNETLWNDLEFSGYFDLIGKSFYPSGSFAGTADIDPAQWLDPAVDAQMMSFGRAEVDADGRFYVEAHLWDLQVPFEGRERMGTAGLGYRIELSERGARTLAHQIADRIVAELSGARGIAQTRIAFVSDRFSRGERFPEKEIFTMDYDGYNQQQVTTLASTALTPRWSPDNRRIAYTHMTDNGVDIAIISPLDRQGFSFPLFDGTTTTPAWSPDGRRIAFASSHEEVRGQPDMEIFLADANGQNVRRLTVSRGTDISPVWNPVTGNQIAFVSDRTGTPQIFITDAEGGNLMQISEGGHADEPSWSPDGRMIAYAWQPPGGASDIYIYDFQTRRNYQLTRDAGFNERPSWSPDGRHLVFQSDRGGTMQIHTMLANGTRVRRLTSQGNNESPAWSHYMAQ